ncbi:MAG: tRNA uridine(34) 5-carboxymethylaminomethyl modification radical SAM/GNAT enzyme Elp3, partial [Microgenomates group bacterium]
MQSFDYTRYLEQLVPFLKIIEKSDFISTKSYQRMAKKFSKPEGGVFAKDQLIFAYKKLAGTHGLAKYDLSVIAKLKMKPVRTMSGVSPITVLTKPFPCPGKCIFCPNDIRMPKSYLSDEPGAQRAERNWFDPYLQTYNRLQALENIGHVVEKSELIILGGTWSYYPEKYQIWFIKECFRALNDFGKFDNRPTVLNHYEEMQRSLSDQDSYSPTSDPKHNKIISAVQEIDGENLKESYNQVVSKMYVAPERLGGFDQYQSADWPELEFEQKRNETAHCRSVGLVIETRPDNISKEEVRRIRRLGCTKTQIGLQSLQDAVLKKNNRGHDVAASRYAIMLLRQAGFKIHAHWMANLYGSSVGADKADFDQLFADPDFRPDELKIYPCSLIQSAELMQYYKQGKWKPYTKIELAEVLVHSMISTPEYCRLTRIIRDIPSPDIVVGNTLTNFRQIVTDQIKTAGGVVRDIRAREVRNEKIDEKQVILEEIVYETSSGAEHFLQFLAPTESGEQKLLAFLRLSLPSRESFMKELQASAIIREIHVYGTVVEIGRDKKSASQHQGYGTKLIAKARQIAKEAGFDNLAVISAVGTRPYYRKKGFQDCGMYQV